jgi:hypothetical protein
VAGIGFTPSGPVAAEDVRNLQRRERAGRLQHVLRGRSVISAGRRLGLGHPAGTRALPLTSVLKGDLFDRGPNGKHDANAAARRLGRVYESIF